MRLMAALWGEVPAGSSSRRTTRGPPGWNGRAR